MSVDQKPLLPKGMELFGRGGIWSTDICPTVDQFKSIFYTLFTKCLSAKWFLTKMRETFGAMVFPRVHVTRVKFRRIPR